MPEITGDILVYYNQLVGEAGSYRLDPDICLSSFCYLEGLKSQIATIYRSLIINHPFINGNKRTAALTYIVLSDVYQLPIVPDEEIFTVTVETAKSTIALETLIEALWTD